LVVLHCNSFHIYLPFDFSQSGGKVNSDINEDTKTRENLSHKEKGVIHIGSLESLMRFQYLFPTPPLINGGALIASQACDFL